MSEPLLELLDDDRGSMTRLGDLLHDLTCHDGNGKAAMPVLVREIPDADALPRPRDFSQLAKGEIPQTDWLIENVLAVETLGMLTGDTGEHKTWYLLDAGISVSLGESVWDRFPVRKAMPVLYIDEENGEAELSRRVSKLARGRDLVGRALPFFTFSFTGLRLDDPVGIDTLRALVECYRPGLVILDSFVRFHGAGENDNTAMAQITSALRSLIRDTGASVWSAHHPNKPPVMGHRSAVDRARGAKEIVAGLDSYIFAQGAGDGATILKPAKIRQGIAPQPFSLRLVETEDGGVTVACLGSAAESDTKLRLCEELICGVILDAQGRLDRPTILAACKEAGYNERTAKRSLARLVEDGEVYKAGIVNRRQIYAFGGDPQEALGT